ncbi:MAG: pentapeptide repeat-containing protein [Clostridium perfringens]|nr:pentapeptide repeat-containing protein [Clostridium perfringens]
MKLINKASEKEKKLIQNGELETLEGAIKFKQGYVFDVSQTNMPSSELPKIFPNKWLEGDVKNYKSFYKSLEDVASKIGVKIIEAKSELGLVKGVSYTSTREVALNPRNSELQNVKTLIHELAHAKLHTVETRDNYTKAEKEFQAEMVALSVSSYFGINTEEYSLRYLSEWTKNATFKDKEKLLKEVNTTVKEYVEIMEGRLNLERELTKENELVNSLSDKNIKNESELNLEIEGEVEFENEKIIKIKDENIKEFLRTDKIVIHELSKSELEELVDNNKSFIWFKTEKGKEINSDVFTKENHIVAVKEKGVYQDVYVRKSYDLENLIYVDDKKNLCRISNKENNIEIEHKKINNSINKEGNMKKYKLDNDISEKIRKHELWLESNKKNGERLDLEGRDLRGVRFLNVNLKEANFKNSDLEGAIFFANLTGANLEGTNLKNTKFIGSNIKDIAIEPNKLERINLEINEELEFHNKIKNTLKTNNKEKNKSKENNYEMEF